MSAHEPESIRRLRRENLAGLPGRVLEVGAGTGTNFEFYPDTVTEVVAVEPERRLAEHGAAGGRRRRRCRSPSAPTPSSSTRVRQSSRSTPWCARWCCARSRIPKAFCGNCFRCCGRVASCATSSTSPAAGRGGPAEVRRRHGLAADARQLPHPSAHRGAISAPGSRWRRPARVDVAAVGAGAGRRIRDRPRGQARPSRAGRAAAATARAARPPRFPAATPWRRPTAAWARG